MPDLPPTFTTREARARGLHPRDLYRMRDDGELLELSRGVFRHADAPVPTWGDLLAVAHRAPRGIVCCISALAVHDLTDEIPSTVQIAVPRDAHRPVIDYPPTEVLRFDIATFDLGLTEVEAAPGEPIRVYSPARTVVDMMRLRGRFGEPLAHAALRRYLARRDALPRDLVTIARELDVLGPVRIALDIASAL